MPYTQRMAAATSETGKKISMFNTHLELSRKRISIPNSITSISNQLKYLQNTKIGTNLIAPIRISMYAKNAICPVLNATPI